MNKTLAIFLIIYSVLLISAFILLLPVWLLNALILFKVLNLKQPSPFDPVPWMLDRADANLKHATKILRR